MWSLTHKHVIPNTQACAPLHTSMWSLTHKHVLPYTQVCDPLHKSMCSLKHNHVVSKTQACAPLHTSMWSLTHKNVLPYTQVCDSLHTSMWSWLCDQTNMHLCAHIITQWSWMKQTRWHATILFTIKYINITILFRKEVLGQIVIFYVLFIVGSIICRRAGFVILLLW